jgi:hypothetical protein
MISFLELYDDIRNRFSSDDLADVSSEQLLGRVYRESRAVDWEPVFRSEPAAQSQVTEASCVKLKDAGTKLFQNNQLPEAVQMYNDYLRMCQRLPGKSETKRQLIFQGNYLLCISRCLSDP